MTKKDYIKIANVLKNLGGFKIVVNPCQLDMIIEQFCYMLADDNSKFDSDKFIKYVNGGK